MLSIHEVSKRYGDKTALENVSLELSEGVYALLGPNGAGKSTLMKIITDSLAPTSGQVFWNHTPVQKLGGAYRSLLGYMPQQQGVCEQMTAESFISYIGRLKGLKGKALRAQVDHVLELVNLSDVRHKKVGGFSGGMKQRVLLAQALLGSPKTSPRRGWTPGSGCASAISSRSWPRTGSFCWPPTSLRTSNPSRIRSFFSKKENCCGWTRPKTSLALSRRTGSR